MNLRVPRAPSADAERASSPGEADAAGLSRSAARRSGGRPLPHGPPRPSRAPPPARPPARGPAYSSARPGRCSTVPFRFQEPRGGYELDPRTTADGSRRSAHLPPGSLPLPPPPGPRPPAPGPASAAVGWMRSGCPVRSQAGAAAEAGRAPPSQRRGPG